MDPQEGKQRASTQAQLRECSPHSSSSPWLQSVFQGVRVNYIHLHTDLLPEQFQSTTASVPRVPNTLGPMGRHAQGSLPAGQCGASCYHGNKESVLLPVTLVMPHKLGSLIFLSTLLTLTRSGLSGKYGPQRNPRRGNTAGTS